MAETAEARAKRLEYGRQYRERNRERLRARAREYYQKSKANVLANEKTKRAENKAKGLRSDGKPLKPKLSDNPHYHRDRARKRNFTLRIRAIQNLGGECVRCGYDDITRPGVFAFQVDHIEPIRAPRNRTKGQVAIREAARGNTDNLQLLCANCHAIKTIDEDKTWLDSQEIVEEQIKLF